jgi:hypothetical protein
MLLSKLLVEYQLSCDTLAERITDDFRTSIDTELISLELFNKSPI